VELLSDSKKLFIDCDISFYMGYIFFRYIKFIFLSCPLGERYSHKSILDARTDILDARTDKKEILG
jgi:hypothetical protein